MHSDWTVCVIRWPYLFNFGLIAIRSTKLSPMIKFKLELSLKQSKPKFK